MSLANFFLLERPCGFHFRQHLSDFWPWRPCARDNRGRENPIHLSSPLLPIGTTLQKLPLKQSYSLRNRGGRNHHLSSGSFLPSWPSLNSTKILRLPTKTMIGMTRGLLKLWITFLALVGGIDIL
jgi:hypothetical protein